MRVISMRSCNALRQPAWIARTAAPTCGVGVGLDVLLEEVYQAPFLLQQGQEAERAVTPTAGRSRAGRRLGRPAALEADEQGEDRTEQEGCAAEEPDEMRALADRLADGVDHLLQHTLLGRGALPVSSCTTRA
jgi:cytochrome c5